MSRFQNEKQSNSRLLMTPFNRKGLIVPYFEFLWTDEIVEHLAEHDIAPEDFEDVVSSPEDVGASDSSGLPCAWGETADGRFIICVYEDIDGITLLPVTAYEVPRPGESH